MILRLNHLKLALRTFIFKIPSMRLGLFQQSHLNLIALPQIQNDFAILNINTHKRKKMKVKKSKRRQRRKKMRKLSAKKKDRLNY